MTFALDRTDFYNSTALTSLNAYRHILYLFRLLLVL
jgi:hypothetical protein